jgi:hypothetical protein
MTTFVVDPNDYASAASTMDQVGSGARAAVSALAGALGGSSGMAGSDKPAESFAKGYDPGARQALQAAANIVNSAGSYATLLHATGANHAGADADSTIGGGDRSLPGAPSPSQFSAPSVPSSLGGTKEPDGTIAWIWHKIEGYVGYVWPNGHQDQLRAASSAWKTAASSVQSTGDGITSALALINAQQSPEVSLAAQKHTELKKDFDNLVEGAHGLSDACEQYAAFIDEAHESLVEMLEQAVIEAIAIEAAGAAGALFSFGASEAAAQATLYARILAWANKARQIIQKLIEMVERVIEPLMNILRRLGEIVARVGSAFRRGGKAVEEAGEEATTASSGMLRGTNERGQLTSRGKFRKATEQDSWEGAEEGPNGGRLCPSCGKEVMDAPGSVRGVDEAGRTIPRDWDISHNPSWTNREFDPNSTRKEVLDNYNEGVGLECPSCNRSGGNNDARFGGE